MKPSELRDLSPEELQQREKEFKKELYELNFQRKMGRVEKPSRFRILRRDIARILTVLKEREQENERKSRTTK